VFTGSASASSLVLLLLLLLLLLLHLEDLDAPTIHCLANRMSTSASWNAACARH